MRRGFESEATKMEAGIKNEENERSKVYDDLTNMKEEIKSMKMGGSCAVSSAAK